MPSADSMNGNGLLIASTQVIEAIDVTSRIPVPCDTGFVWVSVPHTSAALVLCEADDAMLRDIERAAEMFPGHGLQLSHARGGVTNGAAHLLSALAGTQLVLPVAGGRLDLGTWQRVILIELDGPKKRRLMVRPLA